MNNRMLPRLLYVICSIYLGACSYLYFFQRSILYLPEKYIEEPAKYGLSQAQSLTLTTSDNINITAWYIPAKSGKPTLVYFHGNSGNLGRRADKFKVFSELGIGVMAVSYRGFGNSQGAPSEQGLYRDAHAAINYLITQKFNEEDLVLYGESLGTGVAVQMATEHNFRAVILEAPYDSIGARASELYPYAPIKLLLKDKFSSIEKIAKIHSPLMIFHSKDDKIMPFKHGQKLFDAANQPKIFYAFEDSGHSHFDYKELANLILKFTQSKNNQ